MINIFRGILLSGILSSALLLQSCSSIFAVGHENFRCQGTDKGGVCAPVDKIYENKEELLETGQISPKVEYIKGNLLTGKTTVYEVEEVAQKQNTLDCPVSDEGICELLGYKKIKKKKIFKPIVELPLRAKQDKYNEIPVPVREEALIQRVLVYPYVSRNGNLVSKHFLYVVVRDGRWLSPEGYPYKEKGKEE